MRRLDAGGHRRHERHDRLLEAHLLDRGPQPVGSARDEWRVEGTRDLELDCPAGALALRLLDALVDGGILAGHHDLAGAVVVGRPDAEDLAAEPLHHVVREAEDRRHRAGIARRGLGHRQAALAQAYGMVATGLSRRALVVGGDVLSRILDWTDRSTVVLFGDGAGAVVLEPSEEAGFLAFELGADGAGGENLWLPGSGSRLFEDPDKFVKMNGREVFKFATRVLVQSAQAVLDRYGASVHDVDVYVPHQANVRIIDHATKKLGIPSDRVVVNVDRYGNTSSGSIPLALAEAQVDGRLRPGKLVLMTGMGAGLTWGSALMRWTEPSDAA